MDSFVDFNTRLIYGTGAEAEITPNHDDWVTANPSPSGADWLDHHVDRVLPAFEGWLTSHNLPPIIPWDGTRPEPWDATADIPLGTDLDGSFTGIATLDDLGAALDTRYTLGAVAVVEVRRRHGRRGGVRAGPPRIGIVQVDAPNRWLPGAGQPAAEDLDVVAVKENELLPPAHADSAPWINDETEVRSCYDRSQRCRYFEDGPIHESRNSCRCRGHRHR